MNEANKLNTIIIPKFFTDCLSVMTSFKANDIPTPKIGPIKGEINMAPITTAVEFAFKPIDATKTANIKIQAVAPLKVMSAFIASIVAS
jgi:hypothetical protein